MFDVLYKFFEAICKFYFMDVFFFISTCTARFSGMRFFASDVIKQDFLWPLSCNQNCDSGISCILLSYLDAMCSYSCLFLLSFSVLKRLEKALVQKFRLKYAGQSYDAHQRVQPRALHQFFSPFFPFLLFQNTKSRIDPGIWPLL